MTINHRLKEYLELKGINYAELGRMIITQRGDVAKWFNSNGMTEIPPKKVLEIIRKLNDINARWLITGEGEMLEGSTITPTEDELIEFGGTLLDRLLEEKGKSGAYENEIKHLNAEIDRLRKKCGESDRQSARAG